MIKCCCDELEYNAKWSGIGWMMEGFKDWVYIKFCPFCGKKLD